MSYMSPNDIQTLISLGMKQAETQFVDKIAPEFSVASYNSNYTFFENLRNSFAEYRRDLTSWDVDKAFKRYLSDEQKKEIEDLQKKLLEKFDAALLMAHSYEVDGKRYYIKKALGLIGEPFGEKNINNEIENYIEKRGEYFQQPHPYKDNPHFYPEFGPVDGGNTDKISLIEKEIRAIVGNPFDEIRKISKKHNVLNESVLSYIFHRSEKWADCSAVACMLAFPRLAKAAAAAEWVEKYDDYALNITGALRKEFGVDMKSHIAVLAAMKIAIGDDAYNADVESFKTRHESKPKRVKFREVKGHEIQKANNIAAAVSGIFSEATVRPREAQRETGGRAGWGARRPDLWKPENK